MEKYKEQLLPKLEKLPVPDLQETITSLSQWLEPLITNEQLLDFQKSAMDFSSSDGLLLQKDLINYAESTAGSWLAPFWEESYLESRGHLQSESNFALVIDPTYYEQLQSREVKAAQLIYQLTKIYLSLTDGTYPIDYTKNNQHLDMSFYINFFKSCRIPGSKIDSFYKGKEQKEDNYVVIFVSGTYFRLNVTDVSGEIYSMEQLVENMDYILSLEHSSEQKEELIPYLTSVKREQSALIYEQLKLNETNQNNLKQIEEALFILSFSQGDDHNESERINDILLNTSHQFLAKTTQAIITKHGYIGFNMEHTAIDGVPTLNMLTKAFESFNESPQVLNGKKSSSLVQKFEWVLSNELICTLEKAKKYAELENASYVIKYQLISEIGKERMKQAKVSPDAFFHIALAMAQQKVFGTLKSVYEPVAMRMFYEGRTECARSISQEKKDFVTAFYKDDGVDPTEEVLALFLKAATAHSKRINQCQRGQGVERHLFGLQKMALNSANETTFFSSEALKILGDDFISTTGIPYDLLESFSFGPVNKAGFGIYYGILDDQVIVTVSAKKSNENNAAQMLEAIQEALLSLTTLLNI
ncbi:carnitine O-acetyltransferase [Enterococcus sp. DIV0212c]|uniref:choline/carnitine O-acyltransferase n=1 Tax=Enterococcus sp. DIV0212c TaxID=2230867 RepID=UPI001A9BF21C|nr:choline/carnitine O-acyltransferase [Enterococcus sp. DIV0212c]MBO1352374.1 choline/carnitine O-acyltransferase [Enterococcus sp. DIV0212c]